VEYIFLIQYKSVDDGQVSIKFGNRGKLLSKVEDFLCKGYDFIVLISCKDTSTQEEIYKLGQKYSRNYTSKINAPNIFVQTGIGVFKGATQALEYGSVAAAGFAVIELGADGLKELMSDCGHQLIQDILITTADFAGNAALLTSTFIGPMGMVVNGAVKGFCMYKRAKTQEESAAMMFIFQQPKPKPGSDDTMTYALT
jgi:hypothetical protein